MKQEEWLSWLGNVNCKTNTWLPEPSLGYEEVFEFLSNHESDDISPEEFDEFFDNNCHWDCFMNNDKPVLGGGSWAVPYTAFMLKFRDNKKLNESFLMTIDNIIEECQKFKKFIENNGKDSTVDI